MENSLQTQKDYFELVVRTHPTDVLARFALAQILKDMGHEDAANRVYDEAIALSDRQWLPKLSVFALASATIALIVWLIFKSLWVSSVLFIIGPLLWFGIRRNRHYWLPQVGFMQRQQTIERHDLAAELKRLMGEDAIQQSGASDRP